MPRVGILWAWAMFGLAGALAGGCRSEARAARHEQVVTLLATAEVKGTVEPCGCSSDPLGGVAKIVTLARGGLLVDAGGLLYDREGLSPAMRPQADLKAALLADVYRGAPVGLGPDDLARGPDRLEPARQAANARGLRLARPTVRVVNGVRVGIFGVVSPERLAELGVKADPPEAAARAAVNKLRAEGAQVIVALCGMSRVEARGLLHAVDGIGFGIVGAEVGEGMPEAEPVGHGFLVAPADQGRKVARLELHVIDGKVALAPFAGESARRLELERVKRKIATLSLELAGWLRDPHADHAFVKARKDELAGLEARSETLAHGHPTPPASSYFTYSLDPVRVATPDDPKVAAALGRMYRRIGEVNLAEAKKTPPPAAEPGKPTYVGMAACEKCHASAVAFWKKTVHAQAWKTLVDVGKQYDYDCTGCHVTGWMKPGGVNLATVEKRGLVNIQCEVCHGPGSKHVAEAGLDDPPTLIKRPPDSYCADNCHTREHSDTFQLVPYLRDVLGPGHGAKLRASLGEGVTGHELRQKAVATAGR